MSMIICTLKLVKKGKKIDTYQPPDIPNQPASPVKSVYIESNASKGCESLTLNLEVPDGNPGSRT